MSLKEFFKTIYYRKLSIEGVERIQDEFHALIDKLEKYKPLKPDYNKRRDNLLINATRFYDGRKIIVNAFRNKIFPIVPSDFASDGDVGLRTDSPSSSPTFSSSFSSDPDIFDKFIKEMDDVLDSNIIRKYFYYDSMSDLLKTLNTSRGKILHKTQINAIKNGQEDLKNDIEKMSEKEVGDKKLNLKIDLVERILDFDEQSDMSPLESEEAVEQRRNQQGKGLEILTPEQMLNRLPISLLQLKAGNNSQKLKNEIRQLLYSLYRSKKLNKTICKHLMNAI